MFDEIQEKHIIEITIMFDNLKTLIKKEYMNKLYLEHLNFILREN